MQKRELEVYKQQGLAVEEKNPAIGVVLGFLPGGGSFYVREYGFGVIDLLFWPVSILWDPINGANGANSINYTATKMYVNQLRQKELDGLQERLRLSEIDAKQYSVEKDKIERKYSGDL
jgi:beta-glucanase (GH16 family)